MIHVCYSFHDKSGSYYKHAVASMASVLDHASEPVRVHILSDDSLPEPPRQVFHEVARSYGGSVEFTDVTEITDDDAQAVNPNLGKGTLYRLVAPALLEVARVVHLDVDTICRLDLAALYGWDMGDALVGAVPDQLVSSRQDERSNTRSMGLDPDRYFNAGVLLLDLEGIRTRHPGFLMDVRQLLKRRLRLADQDALNLFFKPEEVCLLPERFNFLAAAGSRAHQPLANFEDKLLHYVKYEPWNYSYPSALFYWQYLTRCFPDVDLVAEMEKLPAVKHLDQALYVLDNDRARRMVRRLADVQCNGLFAALVNRIRGKRKNHGT